MMVFFIFQKKMWISRIKELLLWISLEKDIIPRIHLLNIYTIPCSVSFLPLESYNEKEAYSVYEEYTRLVEHIEHFNASTSINNDITIKLYQFGQYKFKSLCTELVIKLTRQASQKWVFIRYDTSDRTEYQWRDIIIETITLFEEVFTTLQKEWIHPLVWICVQSYHLRTDKNMKYLIEKWYRVRLVKWFYINSTITNWSEVSKNYIFLAKKYLIHKRLSRLAIASHDKKIIANLLQFIEKHNISKWKYEIQWFRWIQDQYYKDLADLWHPVRLYIPYWNFIGFITRWRRWMDTWRILQRLLQKKEIK